MRIALVTEWFYPDVGGVASHVMGLARALKEKGHEVTVFTPSGLEYSDNGYRVVKLKRVAPLPHAPPRPGSLSLLGSFDVVHAHHAFSPTPLLSLIKASREGVPIVVTNHTLAPLPTVTSRVLFPLRLFLSRARAVISVSKASAEFISRLYDGPVRVIPNGVDTELFKPPRSKPEFPRVLFVGRLVYRKGVHVLLRAFTEVQREVRDAELVIAGRGPLRWPLERLAKRLGVAAKFLGYVPRNELSSLYRSAAVFTAPSLHAEAFCITIIEAMASGLPVVASSCGGIPEVFECGESEVGILVRPGEPKELSEAIITLLEDSSLARVLGERARRHAVSRFDWSVVAGMVERVYEEVIT